VAEFVPRFFKYFPSMLTSFAFYLGVAAVVHVLVKPEQEKHAI
jgi:hypothetical protein